MRYGLSGQLEMERVPDLSCEPMNRSVEKWTLTVQHATPWGKHFTASMSKLLLTKTGYQLFEQTWTVIANGLHEFPNFLGSRETVWVWVDAREHCRNQLIESSAVIADLARREFETAGPMSKLEDGTRREMVNGRGGRVSTTVDAVWKLTQNLFSEPTATFRFAHCILRHAGSPSE